jgi:hypothetical protein
MDRFETLFGPELTKHLDLEFQRLDPPKPVCSFCKAEDAVYVLDKILVRLATSDHALHTVESNPSSVVACCVKDKNSDNDEYVAGAVHLSIMHDTNVQSDLVDFDVYWKML